MNPPRRVLLAVLVLATAGALRMPVEQALTTDWRAQGLLSKPLEIDVREKIGQNSWAVALAGLRTLVATFAFLEASGHFADRKWLELEDSIETAVRLAPRGSYYWDMGAWHMAYNAASHFRLDAGKSPVMAKAEAHRWIEKGRAFYRRGIANNPGDWRLPAAYGTLLSDPFREPDDAAAAEAYRLSVATGEAPEYIQRQLMFAEARSGTDPARILGQVRDLLKIRENRVPTLLCLRFALECQLERPDDPVALALEVFGSEEKARRNLGLYFLNNVVDRMPDTGVETAVRLLERRQGISPEDPRSFIRQREKAAARQGQ